jgi:hypothetical protein
MPYDYTGEHGNKPYPLERMLRINVMQNLYILADRRRNTRLWTAGRFRISAGVDSGNQVNTIDRFRNIPI